MVCWFTHIFQIILLLKKRNNKNSFFRHWWFFIFIFRYIPVSVASAVENASQSYHFPLGSIYKMYPLGKSKDFFCSSSLSSWHRKTDLRKHWDTLAYFLLGFWKAFLWQNTCCIVWKNRHHKGPQNRREKDPVPYHENVFLWDFASLFRHYITVVHWGC